MESHAARIRWAVEALNAERPLMAERIEVKVSRRILDTLRAGVAPEISNPSAEVDAVLSAVPFFQRHADSIGVDDSD